MHQNLDQLEIGAKSGSAVNCQIKSSSKAEWTQESVWGYCTESRIKENYLLAIRSFWTDIRCPLSFKTFIYIQLKRFRQSDMQTEFIIF